MSKENIVKGAISHPVVFNAFFNDKRFLKDFLNSTGLFNIEEDSIIYLKNTMENVVQLSVPLVVDIGIGKNWKEAH